MSATSRYLDQFAAFAANGGGAAPAWLRDVRRAAIARFETLGFPTPKDEDWHFTSAAPIADAPLKPLHHAAKRTPVGAGVLAPYRFEASWPTLVFVNGRYDGALSDLSRADAGLRVMELTRGWREMPDVLERHLTRIASYDERSFTALNTAFLHDGALVHVAAGMSAASPVHLVFVSDDAAADSVAHLRILIVVDRGASASVVESYVGLGAARYFTNGVTEAYLADGATLRHVKVQRESVRAFHVHTLEAAQGRDSHLQSFSLPAAPPSRARTSIPCSAAPAAARP